jgi:hypothetical protein
MGWGIIGYPQFGVEAISNDTSFDAKSLEYRENNVLPPLKTYARILTADNQDTVASSEFVEGH